MNIIPKLLWICNKVHNISLPKIKFRNLPVHYKIIYQKCYNIDEEDINKITFLVFSITWSISILISIMIHVNFAIISLIFFILAFFLSYLFNSYLFKKTLKSEIRLNALLYFIKINFSILKESLTRDSDYLLWFLRLIKNFKIPISNIFESALIKIHEGANPEIELRKIITPSAEFNDYMKNVVLGHDVNGDFILEVDHGMLEGRFKVYLHQIETRMSLVFFVGIFFPLGLCFLILFYRMFIGFSILLLPFFFLAVNALFRQLIKNDAFLLGLLNNYNNIEKKRFDEFTYFLKNFAYQLQENISPEIAFIYAFSSSGVCLELLYQPFKEQINSLLSLSSTFAEMIELIKKKMKTVHYYLILDIIKQMVVTNAFNSSKKIFNILNIISNHQKLEKKLEIIIKGEKFKVGMFLFLLPIIIGTIGGMFPIFTLLVESLNLKEMTNPHKLFELIFSFDFLIIYFILLICILIASYFFLKTINSSRINACLAIIIIIYSILFLLSFFVTINLL